jgi:hypothetical protein
MAIQSTLRFCRLMYVYDPLAPAPLQHRGPPLMSIRSQASDGEPRQAPDPAVVRYIHSLAAIVYGPQALTTESGPQGPALQKLRYEAIRTLAAAPVDSPGGAHSMELGEMEGILRIE